MSVVNRIGVKQVIRPTNEAFWAIVLQTLGNDPSHDWQALGMLALYVNGGWPITRIAMVFQIHKGNVARALARIKQKLRDEHALNATLDELRELADTDLCFSE